MLNLSQGEYFGKTVRSRNINGLFLTEKLHPEGEILPKHSHKNPYFCNVLNGNWREQLQTKERECRPFTSIFHPSGEVHSDEFKKPGQTFNIEFEQNRVNQFNVYSINLSDPGEYFDEINWLAVRLYKEFKSYDEFSNLSIEGLIMELVAGTARHKNITDEKNIPHWLTKVKDILHDRYNELISFKDIAVEVGTHPVHLSRTFRKYFGCTMGEYHRKLRLKKALIELTDSEIPILDIALNAGFYDHSHFIRIFKQYLGVSPHKIRAGNRNDNFVLPC